VASFQPTPRAILLAAAAFPAALLPSVVHPRLWGVWLVCLALAALAIGLDALLALAPRELRVRVEAPQALAVGEPGSVVVLLEAPRPAREVEVLCELHPDFEAAPPDRAPLPAGARARLSLPLRARRRGRPTVDEVWCRWTGPFGLVRRQLRRPVGASVSVVPDVRPVRAAAFRYFGSRELAAGVQVERFVGDGSEFEALREYARGLDPRAIDWKASARHLRLMSQEFRAERNHQVVLALDTGRLMAEPLDGVPRLDHAVTSALLLAYVSLRLGDRVGIYGFDEAARLWAPPQRGLAAFARLQAIAAGLEYSPAETNFTLGLAELSARLRRRSLVVVLTDFVDTVAAELMVENLARLARKQLVVFVALRDQAVDAMALARPARGGDVYRAVVAAEVLRDRERVLARLRRMGIACVDAAPGLVSTRLVNCYLDIKRRERV
jgi:uncharacterized protein (DUF58 family)